MLLSILVHLYILKRNLFNCLIFSPLIFCYFKLIGGFRVKISAGTLCGLCSSLTCRSSTFHLILPCCWTWSKLISSILVPAGKWWAAHWWWSQSENLCSVC